LINFIHEASYCLFCKVLADPSLRWQKGIKRFFVSSEPKWSTCRLSFDWKRKEPFSLFVSWMSLSLLYGEDLYRVDNRKSHTAIPLALSAYYSIGIYRNQQSRNSC
ncbi:MAG TPA: hypothetical protein H9944_04360, partial [Candidatus Anaeromassilibacillus stercoravium]|nr:hypothetical protein [Candidatus Anaeromassilibacillus stercoravium]